MTKSGKRNTNTELDHVKDPQLLFSSRLSFFVICLFAGFVFIILRVNINFALVCMVKSPHSTAQRLGTLNSTYSNANSTFANGESERISIDSLEIVLDEDPTECQASGLMTNNESGHIVATKLEDGVFEWDKSVQANILSSYSYGYLFTNIIGGWVSDKYGGRKSLVFSVFILSFLTLLNPIAALQGPEYLFILRFIQGASQGASLPLITVLSARWAGKAERAFLMSVAYGGFSIGSFVGNPLCAFICKNLGWDYIFYATGGMGVFWSVVASFLIYDWPEDHPRISKEELEYLQRTRAVQPGARNAKKIRIPWRAVLFSAPILAIHFIHFCSMWGYMTLAMYLPQFFKEALKMDIRRNGILSSIPFLGMLVLHWTGGSFFDAMRKKNLCSLTNLRKLFNTAGLAFFSISLCLLSAIPCTDNTLEIVLIFLLTSVWQLAMMGGYFFSLFELAPRYAGIITGLSNTFGTLPGFLSPALTGYLTRNGTRQEWLLVFYIASGLNALGALVYICFGSSELQPWAEAPPTIKETELEVLQEKFIDPANGERANNANDKSIC